MRLPTKVPVLPHLRSSAAALSGLGLALMVAASVLAQAPSTYPGMPPVPDRENVYSETGVGKLSPAVANAVPRVYVPHVTSSDVYVIDPTTLKVLYSFPVGLHAQHVVPSYDLKTLWVASVGDRRVAGSLTPIDPTTGAPGPMVDVDDPYNLYFTPDGGFAIVVAEKRLRLDFRDPHTMELKYSLPVPQCRGVNHADFSIDGRYAIFTCEYNGSLVKIDMIERKVLGYLKLSRGGMPQDIRISPKGDVFFVADMHADGVFVIDGESFTQIDLIHTGIGTHGLYPEPRRHQALCDEPRLAQHARPPRRPRQHLGPRFRHPQDCRRVADPRRRQSRHGQCQRRRKDVVAVRPLRQRGLCDRHRRGRCAEDPGRHRAARPHHMAAAGALLARPHGEYAVRTAS